MHVRRSLLALTLLCGPLTGVHAQENPRLIATIQRNGTITLRPSPSAQPFLALRPSLFETGWQFRSAVTGKTPGEALIRATKAGASVAVTVSANLETTSDYKLHVVYTLTPQKDIPVNSAHIALLTPASSWTKGKITVGSMSTTFPSEIGKSAALLSGTGTASLSRQGTTLAIDAKDQPVLVQDNRVFSAPDAEIRVGKQSPDGRVWQAGETETFDLTLSLSSPIRLIREEPVTLQAGDEWVPLKESTEILANSALDFSSLLDAPAGKYGSVQLVGGHFGFSKSTKPLRFYGVNLCFGANYLEKPEADALADRLARIGYNAVRIHHYDGALQEPGNFDKLDYLVAALKKRGIYIKTDLYVSRPVPETISLGDFKAAILVSDAAFNDWKEFTKLFLNHVNPYTTLAYKDEPALAFLCVVNEPNLTNNLSNFSAPLVALYEKEWAVWRTALKLAPAPLPRTLTNNRTGRELGAFLAHLHERGYGKMKAAIRELGCKALLTDLNGWSEAPALMAVRDGLDFIDNHFYWDHPRFLDQEWQLPSEGLQTGSSAVLSAGAGPEAVAMTRIYGKPFTVSEYNYSAPNRARAEGGLLMGAAAALQDWDGVWRFAWAHSREAATMTRPLSYFDMASDPMGLASERAAVMLFLRSDLRPATNAVSRALRRDELLTKFDLEPTAGFKELTLVTRVGTWIEDASGPLAAPRPTETRRTSGRSSDVLADLLQSQRLPLTNKTNLDVGDRQSETGEILVNSQAQTFKVITPRTVGGAVGENDAIQCGPLRIEAGGTDAVVWLSSLDGKPTDSSGRLLLVHATDAQNTGIRFAGQDLRVLEAWGDLPHLVKHGTASLRFTRKLPGKLDVYRLDDSGKRLGTVPVTMNGLVASFTLDTLGPDGNAVLYYEVVAK